MEITAHSRSAVVAYQDLLRLHLGERASNLVGTIEERQRNGRIYLYKRFRIGNQMMSWYLGEDKPELRARLNRAEELKADVEARRKRMARLARTLRAEGLIATDRETGSQLLEFSDLAAPWSGHRHTASTRANSVCTWIMRNWPNPAILILPVSSGSPLFWKTRSKRILPRS